MKILCTSIGTRGDMEPFMAIGEMMKKRGHDVVCLFPEQFKSLVEDAGFRFASLGSRFLEMIESKEGKAALGGGGSTFRKIIAYFRLARKYNKMNKELVLRQREVIEFEDPDRIVHNGKAVYPVIWGLKNPGKNVLVSPVPYLHYVKGHSHLAFNSDFGAFFNKLTFKIARFGLVKSIMTAAGWLGVDKEFRSKEISRALDTNTTVYTISPSLFPKPKEWKKNLHVLGYHERDKVLNWKPPKELVCFLAKHDKVLFITFGSMTNPSPEEKTGVVLEVLSRNRIPAVINTASGGLVEPENYDRELVHFVDQIPYEWIFPKVHAVVHHGGSGTTHLTLKYGCASMIIPHIVDQFVWNKLLAEKGVGPRGIRIDKVSCDTLEPKILELLKDPSYKEKAVKLASQMAKEDFREELYQVIEK